jgi:micrococcal nuclease
LGQNIPEQEGSEQMKEFVFLNCICTYVVDGDTLDVSIDAGFDFFTNQRLRLLGIDTPERNEKGYQEAKDFLKSMCLKKEIQITTYKKDAFGRWLSVVHVQGENVNELLLKNGLAKPYLL